MKGKLAERPQSKRISLLRQPPSEVSQGKQKQAEDSFQAGRKHMQLKQYTQALKHYNYAIAHNPAHYKSYCNMGAIYKDMQMYEEARSSYRKALSINPNDVVALYNLGNLERVTGNGQQAIKHYQKVIQLKDNQNLCFDSLINLGICYKKVWQYDEAVECYNKAIQIKPNEESGHFNKGMCLMRKAYALSKTNFDSVKMKVCQQAEAVCKRSLQLNPSSVLMKSALRQIEFLKDPKQITLATVIKQLNELKKSANESESIEIQSKFSYLQSMLKKPSQTATEDLIEQQLPKIKNSPFSNQYDQKSEEAREKHTEKIREVNKKSKVPEKNIQEELVILPNEQQNESKESSKSIEQERANQIKSKNTKQEQRKKITIADIRRFMMQKLYAEALRDVNLLPPSPDKTQLQLQILLSKYQSLNQGEKDSDRNKIIEEAVNLYKNRILNKSEYTPITRQLCTAKGHEVAGKILFAYGNYLQATKHFEILLQSLGDPKTNQGSVGQNTGKIADILWYLGICNEKKGNIQRSLQLFEKLLQLKPNSYSAIESIGSQYISSNQPGKAQNYFQKYLASVDEKNMANWSSEECYSYTDALVNLFTCLQMQDNIPLQVEEATMDRAMAAIGKYYPTMVEIKANLSQDRVLGIYTRKAELLEQEYEKVDREERQKYFLLADKLLQTYLTCLEFDYCPDYAAICKNIGILYMLNGCYASSWTYFTMAQEDTPEIYNNLGLAQLYINNHESAFSLMQDASREYPENIIFQANFLIVSWVLGEESEGFQGLSCGSQQLFTQRLAFAKILYEFITNKVMKDDMQWENDPSSTEPVVLRARKLIQSSINQIETKVEDKIVKNAAKLCLDKFRAAKKLTENEKEDQNKILNEIQVLCSKKSIIMSDLCEVSEQLLTKLSRLSKDEGPILQPFLLKLLHSNLHFNHLGQFFRRIKDFRKLPRNTDRIQIASQSAKIEELQSIQIRKIPIKADSGLKYLLDAIIEAEIQIEGATAILIQTIKQKYYGNTQGLLSALQVEYIYPHCQHLQASDDNLIKALFLLTNLFNKDIDLGIFRLVSTADKNQASFYNRFYLFLNSFLIQQAPKLEETVYSKQQQTLTLKIQNISLPTRIKTHFRSYNDAINFLSQLSNAYKIDPQLKSQPKGVLTITLNRIAMLEIWWGPVDEIDRLVYWVDLYQRILIGSAMINMTVFPEQPQI